MLTRDSNTVLIQIRRLPRKLTILPNRTAARHPLYLQHQMSRRALRPERTFRPYSKGPKNDFRDAEAVQRPTMKFVTTKTAEQLNLQALHRVRERLVSKHTGIVDQIRAFLLELGNRPSDNFGRR